MLKAPLSPIQPAIQPNACCRHDVVIFFFIQIKNRNVTEFSHQLYKRIAVMLWSMSVMTYLECILIVLRLQSYMYNRWLLRHMVCASFWWPCYKHILYVCSCLGNSILPDVSYCFIYILFMWTECRLLLVVEATVLCLHRNRGEVEIVLLQVLCL